jgi:hypothetical protein
MAKIDTDLVKGLADSLTGSQRLQDGAALAGTGLVQPLARLRARGASLELARIERRHGDRSAEAEAQRRLVRAAEARAAKVADQHGRRAGPGAEPRAGEAALRGRITRGGVPAPGVTVALADGQGETVARGCTDRDGRYAVTIPADRPLRIDLLKGGRRLYRDTAALAWPPGYQGTRDIDFGEADPVCDETGDGPVRVTVPDLANRSLAQARRMLGAAGLSVGDVKKGDGARGAVVTGQSPAPGSEVDDASPVHLSLGPKGKP